MIILLTHVSYGYPGGIHVSQKIDPLVRSIMEGVMLPSPLQVDCIASDIEEYKQEDERLFTELKDNWQLLEQPRSFS